MDVLSEVLRAVRLTGALYFDVRARAPWVAETPNQAEIAASVMPELEHVSAPLKRSIESPHFRWMSS